MSARDYAGHSGPWQAASDPSHYDTVTDVVDVRGDLVACMCGSDVVDMEANARLIAAAPDLLAALEGLRAQTIFDARVDSQAKLDALRAANAAIAKAEGRS